MQVAKILNTKSIMQMSFKSLNFREIIVGDKDIIYVNNHDSNMIIRVFDKERVVILGLTTTKEQEFMMLFGKPLA